MTIPQDMTILQDFDLKAELKKCKTADDLTGKNGLLQKLVGGGML